MPSLADQALSAAPPEEVWKLLYDPARFPEWWAQVDRVEQGTGPGDVTLYFEGWPDFALPQKLVTRRDGRRVTVSCLVSSVDIEWRLSEDGDGTRIDVRVAIPEDEARRTEMLRRQIAASVRRLAELAATDAPRARG